MKTCSKKDEAMLIFLIVISCFMALYNSVALNAGLPTFMKLFNASVTEVQWTMIGYTVVMGVVSPLTSWFVHRFTLRNYFTFSLLAFAVLSLISGLATNIYIIIAVRALQGVAGAALIPVTMIAIYRFVGRARQPFFLTIQSMSLSLGPAVGPVVAGLLLKYVSWRWLFWFMVPFSLICAYFSVRVFPKEEAQTGESVDFMSIVTIVIGCLLVLLGFSMASDEGLTSPKIISMILFGVLLCAYFIMRQGKLENPVLTFSTLKYREFSLCLVINSLLSMALCLAPFVLAIYLQTVRGYSAFAYGMLLLVPAIFSIGGAPLSQRLYDKVGSKILIAVGLGCLALGSVLLGTTKIDSSIPLFISFLCFRYLGIGMLGMPATDHGMRALPRELQDDGSTLVNWAKLMANSFSLSIFTLVYTLVASNTEAYGSTMLAMVGGVDTVFMSSAVMLGLGLMLTFMLKPGK